MSCHLGAGASACAIADGCSMDTTMGFTPLDGLVMATRAGSVDPGLILWLLDGRLSTTEVADGLDHSSGLAGLSQTNGDMRTVLGRRRHDDDAAVDADLGAPDASTRTVVVTSREDLEIARHVRPLVARAKR